MITVEKGFHQVAYAVTDLESAVRRWADVLGVGPWSGWTLTSPPLRGTYGTAPAEFGFRHALAFTGDLQIELVEPLHGPSLFADQLAAQPGQAEVFSHLGRLVTDHDAATAELLAHGYRPLQRGEGFGASGDGIFAYFAPPDPAAPVVELIRPPTTRFEPELVYPPNPTSRPTDAQE